MMVTARLHGGPFNGESVPLGHCHVVKVPLPAKLPRAWATESDDPLGGAAWLVPVAIYQRRDIGFSGGTEHPYDFVRIDA